MTVMLQLEPQGAELLRKEAAELGLSVEQLASDIIRRHLTARTTRAASADDESFRRVVAASMDENDELLRRLAK